MRATMRNCSCISSCTCSAPSSAVKGASPRSVCLSAQLIADTDLNMRDERICSQIETFGLKRDLRIKFRVQYRRPEHVAPRTFPCSVGYVGGKVRALGSAKLRLIDSECRHGHL